MSMENNDNVTNVPILINQYLASVGNDEEASKNYIQNLSELFTIKKLTLLQLIQNLGSSLTSDNDLIRSKSIQLLSEFISQVKLSRQDINVMIDFLLNKLNDKLSLIYSLKGLNSLILQSNYLNSNNEKILSSLVNNYDPKKNLAKVRYETFQILININDINELFIKAFIHIASGEKDPRNLLLSFKLNNLINDNFKFNPTDKEHEHFIEELFDICFCYFPISFSPPANDPYKITSEELKLSLRKVIGSQSLFANESFPNLIEKLASTNPVIRNDTLKTILICVENYNNKVLEEHWLSLWNALKFEILHNDVAIFNPISSIIPIDYEYIDDNDENKILFLTLIILQKILEKLPNQEKMLNLVVEELNIKEKPKQSIIILSVLGGTSVENYNFLIEYAFKQKWGKYLNIENVLVEENEDKNEDFALNVQKQRELVDNIGFLLISHPTTETTLINYKDHLLIFFSQILTNSSSIEKTLRCKVIQQLINLIKIPHFLTKTNIELILDIFKNIIMETSSPSDIVLKEIIKKLTPLMENSSVSLLVIEFIINPVVNSLQYDDLNQFKMNLKIISELCVNYQVLEVLFIRLLIDSLTDDYLQFVLSTLLELFDKVQNINQFLTNSWYKNLIPKLLNKTNENENYVIIELIGDLVRQIIRFIDKSKHQSILDEIHNKYQNYQLQPTANISIYSKLLSAIDKSCTLKVDEDIKQTITTITTLKDNYSRVLYLQHLCLLVNKFENTYEPELITEDLNLFEIYLWSNKGLIMKLDKVGIDNLVHQLELYQSTKNELFINSVLIYFHDQSIFKNPQQPKKLISHVNNLNVKLLYKQQIFEIVFPYLLKDSQFEILSKILIQLSTKIISSNLTKFSQFILHSFNSNSIIQITTSLTILKIFIDEKNKFIPENLPILIDNLNKLILNKNQEVKILALSALFSIFKTYEIEIVEKFKDQVLKNLQNCLDDNSRIVRKSAIDLRQFLYNL